MELSAAARPLFVLICFALAIQRRGGGGGHELIAIAADGKAAHAVGMDEDKELERMMREAIAAVNPIIRRERLTQDQAITLLRKYLMEHFPEEAYRFQPLQTRKDLH